MSNDTFRDYLNNKLGSIDSHVSELIPDTAELRAMRTNNPELYRDFIDRWLTSIDNHIVDIINGGGIHPGPTPTNELLLAEWDFTQDTDPYIDKINGKLAIPTDLTRDSNGLYFPTTKNGFLNLVDLANYIWKDYACYHRLEIDVGNSDMSNTTNHCRFIMYTMDSGFVYRGPNYNYWSIYKGSWLAPTTPNNDVNYFNNKTLKMYMDNSNMVVDGAYDENINISPNLYVKDLYIGSNNNSIFNTYIKGLRLYAKNN